MSLQEMQQFQGKHKVARADDKVGADQPHTASVGVHQGNAKDLPDDTELDIKPSRWDISTWIGPAEMKQ